MHALQKNILIHLHTKVNSNYQFIIIIIIITIIIIIIIITIIIFIIITGLEKLGFLVNETACSSKQVQEHVVPLVILCS